MKLIFLDTETTGNELAKDRLCQVCFRVDGKTEVEYFKPPLPMSVKSMSVTHITNKMLEDKTAFAGSKMQKDLQKLLKEGIMVAHNALFDKAMLEAEGLKVPRFIDTLRVARFLDENGKIPEYNLQYLRYHLELEVEGNPHDAEGDVNVLEPLFKRLFDKVRKDSSSDDEALEKMIDISSKPHLFKKFIFGKYKGESIEDIVKTDRGYLEWLLRQNAESPEENEDLVYTLKHYLG